MHSAVERVLTERLGSLGARIHAGRSRNDLVAADLRLWTKARRGRPGGQGPGAGRFPGRPGRRTHGVRDARLHAPAACAAGHAGASSSGTRLSDGSRRRAVRRRCPERRRVALWARERWPVRRLGLDHQATAAALGFGRTFDNSMDAVSDRDFGLDFLSACLSAAVHLSRLGEDVTLWCSQEFGFARMDDAFATGSSMMPHKRNPDVAELARAKCGRILGDLVRLATVMKGLPLAYDRDLQEDKEALFDAFDALSGALEAMRGVVATLAFDTDRMRRAARRRRPAGHRPRRDPGVERRPVPAGARAGGGRWCAAGGGRTHAVFRRAAGVGRSRYRRFRERRDHERSGRVRGPASVSGRPRPGCRCGTDREAANGAGIRGAGGQPVQSALEGCPSGRRGTPGERVGGQPSPGFKSPSLREKALILGRNEFSAA